MSARTFLPTRDLDSVPRPRASLGQLPLNERFLTWGARLGALALSWLIVGRLLPTAGAAWFILTFAVANLALLAVGTLQFDNAKAVSDRLAQWVVSAGAVVVFAALFSILFYVFQRGADPLFHLNFVTDTMRTTSPDAPFTQGGVLQAIIGTLVEIAIAVAITLPLGVGTAVFMNEIGGPFARLVRTIVEAMTALPSIVAGLFVYAMWILAFHNPKSGLAGALAISVMMLPIVARASDVVLRVVPGNLREASFGLGASRWSTVWHVVLPTARPGLATALILAIARGIGETSPVLICSAYASSMNWDPTKNPMSSLPLQVFTFVRAPQPAAIQRGYAAAAVLLTVVLILFVVARLVAKPASAKPSLLRRIRSAIRRRPNLTSLSKRRKAPAIPAPVSEEPA